MRVDHSWFSAPAVLTRRTTCSLWALMTSSKKSKVSLETITGYFVTTVGSQETNNVATDVFVTSVIST